jgi:tetratricopeptide (TPR) repeat protein
MIKAGRNEIRMRLARHYLEVCDQAARILRDGKRPVEIVKDVPNVLEAQSAVSELADTLPEAERLCWQFPFALGVAGIWLIGLARTIQWNEKGLGIARQAAPGEPRMQVELQLLANLGYLYSMAGDLLRSRDSYGAAYRFADTLNRPQRVGEIAGHLGEALCELGDYVASSSFLEQSSDLAGPAPARPRALAQLRLGRLYRLMGQSQVAFEFLIDAADICARSQLDELWTLVAAEIAAVGKDTQNYALAIAFYQGILDKLPPGSDLQMEGRITAALGDACFYDNQLAVARNHYGKAITIFGRTGDKVSDGRTQSGIGAVLSAQGNHSEALGYFKLSDDTAMKCGDRKGIEKVFRNVRALRAQLGEGPAYRVLRENAVKMLSGAEEA